jgi:hypothetical protein
VDVKDKWRTMLNQAKRNADKQGNVRKTHEGREITYKHPEREVKIVKKKLEFGP